jgi:hypothetical protein
MREFIAKTGGRYTYIEDFNALQDLTLSFLTIFNGCNNFILSGCETSGSSISNTKIGEGYVYINGKIRKFDGATVNLNNPYYIVESERTESGSYAQNATQQICTYYECFGTTDKPADKQYIEIRDTYIPRLKDEFFGKYALLLDGASQQTVNKTTVFNNNVESKKDIISDGMLSQRNPSKFTMLKIAGHTDGASRIIYHNGGEDLSYISFDTDGNIRFSVGGQDVFAVMKTNTAVDVLRGNTLQTENLVLSDNNIENYSDATDDGSVNVNKSGYQGSTSKVRHFQVYDGKGKLLFKTDGSAKRVVSYCSINEESADELGLVLRSTSHSHGELSYSKRIGWKDRDNALIASIGFSSGNKAFMIKHEMNGDITLQAANINIVGTLKENGNAYSSNFVNNSTFNDALSKKVDKVAGMGLSTNDFTSDYKAQLDNLRKGSIGSGDQGLVTGNDVANELEKKLDKELTGVNAEKGRANLSVYSKSECDGRYADKKLSNLPTLTPEEQASIRSKIGAGASSVQGELDSLKSSINQMIKEYCDANCVNSTDGMSLLINKSETSGGLHFEQRGRVVSIMGYINGPGNSNNELSWFNIPNSIGAPLHTIGGTFLTDTTNSKSDALDNTYGIVWKCDGGTRTVKATSSSVDRQYPVYVCITYITSQ